MAGIDPLTSQYPIFGDYTERDVRIMMVIALCNMSSLGASSGATVSKSSGKEAARVLKAGPGTMISVMGYSSKASAQFIQIHDSSTVPADGAVPALPPISVPASSNFSLDIPIVGCPFTNGITICNSSTDVTKTIGAADCFFFAVIK